VAACLAASEPRSARDIKFCRLAMECQKRKMVLGTGNFAEYHRCRCALFTLKYTPRKSGTAVLSLVKMLAETFFRVLLFCSNVPQSAPRTVKK
jgi:hypothetical protein